MSDNEFHTMWGYEKQILDEKSITSSMEDYLEMLYRCKMDGFDYMRLNKLAELLHVRSSSASKMMQKLGKLELIDYEKYSIIRLTELGEKVGRFLLNRHNTIEKFLRVLTGGNYVLLETELIEHVLSASTLEDISIMNSFIDKNPDVVSRYSEFRKNEKKVREDNI